MDLKQPIETYDLVFLDLETTGLEVVTGDAICEIGAIKIKSREPRDKFHTLVNPGRRIPVEAYQIHKISEAEVKSAPLFPDIAEKLIAFLADSVLLVYNADFDIGFLNHHLKKINYPPIDLPVIDILIMARKTLKLAKYNLSETAAFFNLKSEDTLHRAMADTALTARVFFKLIDILKANKLDCLSDYLTLYGHNDDVFKTRQMSKKLLIKEAIAKKMELKLRYFSPGNTIEESRIKPLHIIEEKNTASFWFKLPAGNSVQIPFNNIFNIEIII